jgi:hypothetical protein
MSGTGQSISAFSTETPTAVLGVGRKNVKFRNVVLAAVLPACLLLPLQTSFAATCSYSTNFPVSESPISEGGRWTNTVSRAFTAPVSTTGGHAIGLNSSAYNDSIAMLTGQFGPDQTITATAYRGGTSGPTEIELHLRMRMVPGSPDQVYTYEVAVAPSLGAVVLYKWAGARGAVTYLKDAYLDGVRDGDVFMASAVGPPENTVIKVWKNGTLRLTYTDYSGLASGNPGIGANAGNPTDGAKLGWRSYSVTSPCETSEAPNPVTVSVSPSSASVAVGASRTFTASVANSSNTSVTWRVNGVTGGNSSVGSITAGGVYTAPSVVPSPATVTVSAVSVADTSKSGSATVTITGGTSPPPPASVSITPSSASVNLRATRQFSATVNNSTNQSVTWQVNGVTGGNTTVGQISSSGLYTAPSSPPSPLTVTVRAVSVADSTKSATSTVTIVVPPPTISGTPATTAPVGQAYSFRPTASDPNGLTLSFTISGRPAWATFSASTGQLSGTPAASHAGSSSAITITVSNGHSQATLSYSLSVPAQQSGSGSYSTEFPLNENPISEGGKWVNTISRTFNAPVSTQGGNAVGLTSSAYNDSIAMLSGTYGRDQRVTATAYRGGPSGAAELEIHLRMRMVPGPTDQIYSYEVDFLPSVNAVVLVRWHGPQGTFTNMAEAPMDGVNDGDVFTASAVGPAENTVFTITKNGRTLLTFTDRAAYDTGNPGIGFDAGTPAHGANIGWKNYSVTTEN